MMQDWWASCTSSKTVTAYYPALAPRELTELADAAAGPWHELVALRDFNPFAWNHAYRPDIYDEARHALSLGQNIEVIVDRRIGERRSAPREDSRDRRCCSIEDELRTQGFAIVELERVEEAASRA